MKITSEVQVFEDIDKINQLFASEEKEFSNKRAKYELVKSKDKLTFKIQAADATAFRAVMNSIAKMLATYDKTKNVVKGEEDGE